MNKISQLVLAITLAISATSFANAPVFKKIATDASFGNGYADVEKFDKTLPKKTLVKGALAEFKNEYWENCGPWKIITSRREAIKLFKELEIDAEEQIIAPSIQKLYDKDEIVAITGAISNNNIECSLFWFNVYGKDGSVLKMRFNNGD